MIGLLQRAPHLRRLQSIGMAIRKAVAKSRIVGVIVTVLAANALYWGVIASDRYVSEAHVVVERTDFAVATSSSGLSALSNSAAAMMFDVVVLRDHLLSAEMMEKLDQKLDLRGHFSDWRRDPMSRLWSESTPREKFYEYMQKRISVEPDPITGVLRIKVQAFTPEKAYEINKLMVAEGERFINELAHRLARDQVAFVEREVEARRSKLIAARDAALAFQNKHGLIAPEQSAASAVGVTSQLEAKLSELQAQRSTLLGYLTPDAPEVVQVDMQIMGIQNQLEQEKAKLTMSSGKPALNQVVEAYQRLETAAAFEQEAYLSTLKALETAQVQATRNLKKISVVAAPNLPEISLQPERIYNIVVGTLLVLALAGIAQLLNMIIRDHMD